MRAYCCATSVAERRARSFSPMPTCCSIPARTTRFGLQLAPLPPSRQRSTCVVSSARPTFGRLSDFKRWRGELFAQVDYVDLAQANDWVHAPLDVHRAQGALRAWIRVDGTEVVGATADLALTNVDARLAPDLEPLQLSSFQGRVMQKRWGDEARGGQEVGFHRRQFVLASGVNFPPLDLAYRATRSDAGPRTSSSRMVRASI